MFDYNNIIKCDIKIKGHGECVCNDLNFCKFNCGHKKYCDRYIEMIQIDVSRET